MTTANANATSTASVKSDKATKKAAKKAAKKASKGSLGAHLKKQNACFYLSAISSIAILVMMFLPWLSIPGSNTTATDLVAKALTGKFQVEDTVELTPNTALADLGVDSYELVEYLETQENSYSFGVAEDELKAFSENIKTVGDVTSNISVSRSAVSLLPNPILMVTDVVVPEMTEGTFEDSLADGSFMTDLMKSSLFTACITSWDLMVFMVPLIIGAFIVHIMYLVTMMRPGHDVVYAGTVSVLLAGITMFVFVFSADAAFSIISKAPATDNFFIFMGMDKMTVVPAIWFLVVLLQKMLFTRIAHKKKKD